MDKSENLQFSQVWMSISKLKSRGEEETLNTGAAHARSHMPSKGLSVWVVAKIVRQLVPESLISCSRHPVRQIHPVTKLLP